ncbi:MAG: DNA polymerase III, subunit gamma and tau [Rickettsiales bacterium]|nr:MAG: DNA polymerase III, subunit gamma and tau [Rickettsiales bacterium]
MLKSDSTYIPFARKYRPSDFSELLGQEVLVKTLTYCIKNHRLAQAHLLTGIRGVGKTSSARIIAKTVNCTELKTSDEQITPCNKCKNCESFNNHNHPDIIEIDAASRTGVDDIREIIESSEYRPLIGKYKLFIIDEVHMLSKSAFNALLKIVEEPPEHVIFIFATTEVQKIPLTVISRCQRYDLRRLTFDEINILIKRIAKQEKIKIDDDALKIIAIKSEGSARDATSMLDQAASYVLNIGDSEIITAENISKMLGLLQTSTMVKLTQLIIANDPASAIALLEEIYSNASNLEYFVQTMSDFMAELSKSKVITTYHNPLYQSYSKEIADILVGTSLSRLSILWQIFSKGTQEIKLSHNELITAEMLIIKAIYACNLPSAEAIMDASKASGHVPASSKTSPALPDIKQNEEENIFNFLKYCSKQKEMEIYYWLLNDMELKNFSDGKMEIAAREANAFSGKIESLLKDWSDSDWKIAFSKQSDIVSLKDRMMEKVKNAGDYQVIKTHFPNANISDIILRSYEAT